MEFYSKIFEWSWSFPLSFLRLHKFLDVFRGRKLSFGLWFRLSTDRVSEMGAGSHILKVRVYLVDMKLIIIADSL